MNNEERGQVIKQLIAISELYGRQFSRDAFTLMADHLSDLSGEEVLFALNNYLRDPNSKSFPMPGQIRALVQPALSSDQLAVEASSKIIEAMAKFGWTNPEKAREFMGEVAWSIVVREGGWTSLCERTTNDDLPILRAQWREMAKVFQIRKQQEKTALPFLRAAEKQLEKM